MGEPTEPSAGVFVTGIPGFIGMRLLRRLVAGQPEAHFYLLVEPRFVFVAERRCRDLEAEVPTFAGRWSVVVGDLRKPGLGIAPAHLEAIRAAVTHVWHLAALYDLAAPQSLAYAINVTGTERVLDLCAACPNLERLMYISTCYVAGLRQGRIYEDELDCGQDFKNHYESTKFWAELKVWEQRERIPTTVFRPAIVAGDSSTGETAKADGPYFMIQLLLTLPQWLPMVHLGRSEATFNVVPVDFVVEAMVRLAAMDASKGGVFALADPSPRTAREFMDMTIAALGRTRAVATVPSGLASRLLSLGAVQNALPIPSESLAYLNHPTRFDVSNTARLLGEDLHCPTVESYWPTLVEYARHHPEIFRRAS